MKKNDEFDKDKTMKMDVDTTANAPEAQKVNPKKKALALILKELERNGVGHADGEVGDAVDALYSAYEADGTVPTPAAFAGRCANGEVGGAVLGMERDPFAKKPLGKRGSAAICAGCVLAIALIGGGAWYAMAGHAQDMPAAGSKAASSAPAAEKEYADDSKADKDDADSKSADGGAKDGDSKADESAQGDGGEGAKAQAEGSAASSGNGSAASSGASSKPANASQGGGSGSKPSGGSTGGSGGGAAQTQKPTHTHNWVPVTTTVHHDAVYKTVHHDAVTQGVCICNGCSAQFNNETEWGAHSEAQLLAGNFSCGSYRTASVEIQNAWDEQVLVSEAWDETVTTGYRCSCGATK